MEKVKLHTRMYGWKHVWLEFADEFQGSVDDPNPDSSQTGMSMMVPIKNTPWAPVYTLHLGAKGNNGHTTIEVSYSAFDNFTFAIHPQKQLSALTKLFGSRDIVVGDKNFDPRFVIKGNDTNKVKDLLANSEIRELIIDESTLEISTHHNGDSKPSPRMLAPDQSVLSLKLPGIVDDFERLKNLYRIAELLLKRLCAEDATVRV